MTWLYSIVFAGLLFSSGSDSVPVSNTAIDNTAVQTAQQNETERIEKSFPLNANGRMHVSNVNGSITLMAWDREEVKLIAVKTADTKEHLDDVDVKIDARPDYISIESDYGDWKTKADNDRW